MDNLFFTPAYSTVPFLSSDKFASFIVGPYGPVSGDTEFLTPSGWKRLDAYASGDYVAQWSPDGRLTFVEPLDYIVTPADTLIEFTAGKLRMCLSDNHRVPYYDYRGAFKETTAAEAAAHPSIRTIPSTFTVDAPGMAWGEAYIRLMVAVHADGHFPSEQSPHCYVTVRKERKKARLRNLLAAASLPWTEKTYSYRPTETRFIFDAPWIGKRFTGMWWSASAQQLTAVLDECVHWDGSTKNNELLYFSNYAEDAAYIQYAAHACGGGASISQYGYDEPHQRKWADSYRVFIAKAGSPKAKRKLTSGTTVTTRVPAVGGKQYCFSTSSTYFLARYNGAVFVTGNSTKTTAGLLKIAHEASRVAACNDGIRRSRCAVVRNTRQMLWDTTIPDFLKWFPDGQAGVLMKTDSKFILKFGDVECEILFRGLDDANDVRRLLSLQLTFGVMDEFREIHPDIYEALAGRVGRYPDKVLVPPRPEWGVDYKGNPIGGCVRDDGSAAKRIWGMSNPPDMDTFWEQLLTDPPNNVHVTLQPSGVSPQADWVHLLDSGYYENLMELHASDPDWVDVYVHSKFGKSLSGKPVFRSFNLDYHVAKGPLTPLVSEQHPLIIGMDFGLTPACTVSQQDPRGRFLTYAEAVSDGMGILRFCRELLRPLLTNRFPGHPVLVIGDPAGNQRAQTDERTVFEVLKSEGFHVIPAKTNTITARIAAVESLLSGQVDTGARHLIDPSCKKLITALKGGYRYRVKTTGEMEDKPDKNYYSHICFAPGTQIATPAGSVPIELLHAGDQVLTPSGAHRLARAWMSSPAAEVWGYTFDDGSRVVATPDHPVYAETRGAFIPLDAVEYGDILVSINQEPLCAANTPCLNSTTSSTTANPADTTRPTMSPMGEPGTCTGMSGGSTTAPSPQDIACTTATTTAATTPSTTWNFSPPESTPGFTPASASRPVLSVPQNHAPLPRKQRNSGTRLMQGVRGTLSTLAKIGKPGLKKPARVPTVGSRTLASKARPGSVFALRRALAQLVAHAVRITRSADAPSAAGLSWSTGMLERKRAVRLVGKQRCPQPSPVYALTVERDPVYFAEGVLVKNCDAHQYAALHVDSTFGGKYVQTGQRREVVQRSRAAWT